MPDLLRATVFEDPEILLTANMHFAAYLFAISR